ncbi:hypothetical protein FACS1894218_1960 [Bacilli bacterium]|nr:hypothetical protein FACS1894218_1960 [Bacilli bacterium]
MLQKKLKLFGSLLVLASFSISIAWTSTSCGDDGNSNPDEFSDFICDRSFSIAIQVPSDDPRYYSYSLGTA